MTAPTRRSASILPGFLTLLFVTGCGGGGGGSAGGAASAGALPELEGCGLFTQADATEALGAPVAQAEGYRKLDERSEATGTAVSNCMYAAQGSYRTAHVVVTYRAAGFPASLEALQSAAAAEGGFYGGLTSEMLAASEPVAGVGDYGFWTPDIATLTVFAGGRYQLAVTVDPPAAGDAAAARAAATAVASKVAGRL